MTPPTLPDTSRAVAMKRWNFLVERFDLLTLFMKDRSTVEEIECWYWNNDRAMHPQFRDAAKAIGYLTAD